MSDSDVSGIVTGQRGETDGEVEGRFTMLSDGAIANEIGQQLVGIGPEVFKQAQAERTESLTRVRQIEKDGVTDAQARLASLATYIDMTTGWGSIRIGDIEVGKGYIVGIDKARVENWSADVDNETRESVVFTVIKPAEVSEIRFTNADGDLRWLSSNRHAFDEEYDEYRADGSALDFWTDVASAAGRRASGDVPADSALVGAIAKYEVSPEVIPEVDVAKSLVHVLELLRTGEGHQDFAKLETILKVVFPSAEKTYLHAAATLFVLRADVFQENEEQPSSARYQKAQELFVLSQDQFVEAVLQEAFISNAVSVADMLQVTDELIDYVVETAPTGRTSELRAAETTQIIYKLFSSLGESVPQLTKVKMLEVAMRLDRGKKMRRAVKTISHLGTTEESANG